MTHAQDAALSLNQQLEGRLVDNSYLGTLNEKCSHARHIGEMKWIVSKVILCDSVAYSAKGKRNSIFVAFRRNECSMEVVIARVCPAPLK